MTQPRLLAELAAMPFNARFRAMVDLGRRAANDAATATFIDALERGNVYERSLALQSCYGSSDHARVLRMIGSSSRSLRGMALPLLALVCDDDEIVGVFDSLSPQLRQATIKALRRRKRRSTIDALLDVLAARSDEELTNVLAFGTADAIARHLPQVRETMTARNWRSIAHAHPTLAADEMERAVQGATEADARFLWQVNAVLSPLAESMPDRALALVRALLPLFSLSQLQLQRLAERLPVETVDLVLEQDDRVSIDLSRQAHALRTDQLIALVVRAGGSLDRFSFRDVYVARPQNSGWFERLTPTQRGELFQQYGTAWRDDQGLIALSVVQMLPPELREAEARRNMALPALATLPNERLAYAALLPWYGARAILDPALKSADAETRGAALAAFANAVRFNRDHAGELLDIVRARRNEQDPVRIVMLTSLADLPPSIWRAEHLDGLAAILRAAFDAADLSNGTALAAERLVIRLLPFHAEWSVNWLTVIAGERGQLRIGLSADRLTDTETRQLAPALLPIFQSWLELEYEQPLISVASSLGRRLRVFDGMLDLLEQLVRTTRNGWLADQALRLIAEHSRQRFARLVPELLGVLNTTSTFGGLLGRWQGDGSWITRSPVYEHLHRQRQDLLTPYLGQRAYSGRWSTGKTRFVLPVFDGFGRWTDEQQRIFAATLREITSERDRDTPSVQRSIQRLAALPAIAPDDLITLARDERSAVRDAALRALGGIDDAAQGAPPLLDALDDDRASVAIYALRGSLLALPADRALELLRQAPLDRVTVAKEVVRLIGDLHTDDAYRELLTLDTRDLHRDVRAALLRALWNYLDRDEPWRVFERAIATDDETFAHVLVRLPTERLTPSAQQRLVALLARLMEHPEPTVRVETLGRIAAQPISDPDRVLFAPLLRTMGSPITTEASAAARALFLNYTERDADAIAQVIEQVLPNRRALSTAIDELPAAVRVRRSRLLPTVQAIMRVLETDRLTANLQVQIAAAALPVDQVATLLTSLAATGHLLADGASALRPIVSRATPEQLTTLEATLAASDDPVVRRYGLTVLVVGANGPLGWDSERIERLRTYQADAAPLVAAAAQFTFPPDEAS